MHIQIIISIRLYRAQCLHGMRYPYLLLLLNFVRLSLMSNAVGLARSEIIVQLALAVPSFYPQLLLLNVIVSLLTMWIKLILSPK